MERRRRELAADKRAGRWARGRAREAQVAFLRRQWRRLLAGLAIMLVPGLTATVFVMPDGLNGFVAGVDCTGAVAMLLFWVVLASGSGPTMMGEVAEQWTAAELRKLERDGWRLVNGLVLTKDGDIDHVLVGSGGVYVLETKWSAAGWDKPRARAYIDDRAEKIARQGWQLGRWEDVKRVGIPAITPMMVLWGPGAPATRRHRCGTLMMTLSEFPRGCSSKFLTRWGGQVSG